MLHVTTPPLLWVPRNQIHRPFLGFHPLKKTRQLIHCFFSSRYVSISLYICMYTCVSLDLYFDLIHVMYWLLGQIKTNIFEDLAGGWGGDVSNVLVFCCLIRFWISYLLEKCWPEMFQIEMMMRVIRFFFFFLV